MLKNSTLPDQGFLDYISTFPFTAVAVRMGLWLKSATWPLILSEKWDGWHSGFHHKSVWFLSIPTMASQDWWGMGSSGMHVWSPAPHSGLKIQHCHSYSLDHHLGLDLSPGQKSICLRTVKKGGKKNNILFNSWRSSYRRTEKSTWEQPTSKWAQSFTNPIDGVFRNTQALNLVDKIKCTRFFLQETEPFFF